MALSAALLASVASVPASATPAPLPRDATLLIPGHGWGHGRGLGQWGAKGMAASGKTYTQIVTHYYTGISIGTRSASEDIRVLVEDASPDVIVTSGSPFTIAWSNGNVIATSNATYDFFRVRWDGSVHRVEKSSSHTGPWTAVASGSSYVVMSPGSNLLELVLDSRSVKLYRGKIIARAAYSKMRAINQLTVQQYLYGVVPREMPASWPAEALKSQALAARTYAVYKKDAARAGGQSFDICATTACQVYGGYGGRSTPGGSLTILESSTTNSAIDTTAGKVMLYGGRPILAEYSSSTGGYSAPGSVPYQRAVPDPGDAGSPNHDWTAKLTVSRLESHFPTIGRLVDVRITRRNGFGDMGGRVLSMELRGTAGTKTITGNDLRGEYSWPTWPDGIRSNWFTVSYWRGTISSVPSQLSVLGGDTGSLVARITNTGNYPWRVGSYVRLATPAASRFAGAGWISPTRPASVYRNVTDSASSVVRTGQVAEFRVPIHTAGVPAGVYNETFRAVADGYSTMDPAFTVQIQVLPGWAEEQPSLISNGSFESTLTPWRGSGLRSGDGISTITKREGASSLRLTGSGVKSAAQTISLAGGRARGFVLGGWNRNDGSSSSGGPVELRATARYSDGTSGTYRVPFTRRAHAWTYDEAAFTTHAAKQLVSITVSAVFSDQLGAGYFDAVRLLASPVANPSFEDNVIGWSAAGLAGGDGVTTHATIDGSRSFMLSGGAARSVVQYISVTARRSERFAFSAWNRSESADAAGPAPMATLTLIFTDGTRTGYPIAFPASSHGWTRKELLIGAAKDVRSAAVTLSSANPSGKTYFDGVRVQRTWVNNPSFESGLTGWSPYAGFSSGDGLVTSPVRDGGSALRLTGAGRQGVIQRLSMTGSAGRRLAVGGWNRTSGVRSAGGPIQILVTFRNSDGTASSAAVAFARNNHGWTYAERVVVAPKRFTAVDVYALFYDQTGTAYFDAIAAWNV